MNALKHQVKFSQDFDVLVDLVRKCSRLASIHVMTVIPQEVFGQIGILRPDLLESAKLGRSTLKTQPEPHPWVSDQELDEVVWIWISIYYCFAWFCFCRAVFVDWFYNRVKYFIHDAPNCPTFMLDVIFYYKNLFLNFHIE